MSSVENQLGASDLQAKMFVWLVFVVLSVSFLIEITRYSRNIPRFDDYYFLHSLVTDNERLTLSWLWEQSAEHRFPLGKLLQWCFYKLGDGDLRYGMVGGFVLACVATAVVIYLVWLNRGCAQFQDVVIPLCLLHAGHLPTFLFFFLAAKEVTTILPLCVLLALARYAAGAARFRAAPLALILLPFCGSIGVICATFAVLGSLTFLGWLQSKTRKLDWLLVISVLVTSLCILVHFLDLNLNPFERNTDWNLRVFGEKVGLFWSGMFGPAVWKLRPLSFLIGPVLVLTSSWLCIRLIRAGMPNWLFVLAALLGYAAVGVAVGLLRMTPGMPYYYYFTASMLLVPIYLVFSAYREKGWWPVASWTFVLLSSAGLFWHGAEGRRMGREAAEACDMFARDCASGIPLLGLVARYRYSLACPSEQEETWARYLTELSTSGRKPFHLIQKTPPLRALDELRFRSELCGLEKVGSKLICENSQGSISLFLHDPQRVKAIQFDFVPDVPCNAKAEVFCIPPYTTCKSFVSIQSRWVYNPIKKPFTRRQTVWIDEEVKQLIVAFDVTSPRWSVSNFNVLVEQLHP